MTDAELIELVECKTPEELSLEEIGELRRRLEQAPELRAALAERPEMERYLSDTLGDGVVSAAEAAARAGGARSRNAFFLPLWGWGALLLLTAVAGLAVTLTWMRPGTESTEDEPRLVPAEPAAVPPKKDPPAEAAKPPPPPPETAAKMPPPGPKDEDKKNRAGGPSKPAAGPRALVGGPFAYYDIPSLDRSGMIESELLTWFAPVKDQNSVVMQRPRVKNQPTPATEISGLLRLHVPWKPGTALRLSYQEFPETKLHFWNGKEGITLAYWYPKQGQGLTCQSWSAYRTTRKRNEPVPATLALVATDEERFWRARPLPWPATGNVAPPLIDLRHEDGMLTLSCADTRVLSVPCARPPEEAYWEGQAVFQQIAWIAAAPLPAEPERASDPRLDARPADLEWFQEQPQEAELHKRTDGAVQLASTNPKQLVRAAVPLPRNGLCEVIAELEGVVPGTGVFLGDARGRLSHAVAFFPEETTGRTLIDQTWPGDRRTSVRHDAASAPAPFVSDKLWLRLLFTCGHLKCWISADGVTWARAFEPKNIQYAAYETFGICCFPGKTRRAVTLRRLKIRDLERLNALAPPELLLKAAQRQSPPPAALGDWLQAVFAAKPADVDPGPWYRACALRALADGAVGNAGAALLERLIDDGLARPIPWEEKLRFLDQALLAFPICDEATAQRLCRFYERVGALAYRAGEARPFSRAAGAYRTAPIWSGQVHAYFPQDLFRAEVLELACAGRWQDLYDLSRSVKFHLHQTGSSAQSFYDWAEAHAYLALGGRFKSEPVRFYNRWRHPLVYEVNKEGFNDLIDIETALAGKSYVEAGRLIAKIEPAGPRTLLPNSADPQWLTSWQTTLDVALRAHPELKNTMREQFAPEARLRLHRALNDEDAGALEQMTLNYPGTEESAEALAWLGERALVDGAPARAFEHYRQAQRLTEGPLRARFDAGAQLSAALLGRQTGAPATAEVNFGGLRHTPAQWQELLDSLQKQHAHADSQATPVLPPQPAPVPAGYEAIVRVPYEGELGENTEAIPYAGVDWFARHLAFALDGNRLVLSNRFQVSLYDLDAGVLRWRAALSRDPARRELPATPYEYPLMPMRPVVVAGKVFVRRMPVTLPVPLRQGNVRVVAPALIGMPTLARLDADTGKVLWNTPADGDNPVVSDPILIQDQLLALTATVPPPAGEGVLSLTVYNPRTGSVLKQLPLTRLRESWKDLRACQLVAVDDTLLVVCGGIVLCCDLAGNFRWLRREVFISGMIDAWWIHQHQEPPLLAGGRCFLLQPGVPCVQCLDPQTGRLHWRKVLPQSRRLVGLIGKRLIIETAAGFLAVDTDSGAELWRHDADLVLTAQLCSGPGGLLYSRADPVPGATVFRPCLVWVDPQTGRERARAPLDGLRHPRPRLGPLIVAGNRLWTFFGREPDPDRHPRRDLIELVPKGQSLPPEQGPADGDRWLRHVDPLLRHAVERLFPGWTLFEGNSAGTNPVLSEFQEEQNVLNTAGPFVLARFLTVPETGTPRLALRVAHDPEAEWRLTVRVNGKPLLEQVVNQESTGGAWKNCEVDLSAYKGQTVWIAVRKSDVTPGARAKWRRIEAAR